MFRKSLLRKMTAVYFLILLLPLVVISLLSYSIYKSSIEKQVTRLSEQILNQAKYNLENYLQQMSVLTIVPYTNPYMLQFLQGADDSQFSASQDLERKIINSVSSSVIYTSNDVIGLFLYAADGRVFYQTKYTTSVLYSDYKAAPWYAKVQQAGNHDVVLGTHIEQQLAGKPYVISIARTIFSLSDYKPIGVVMIDINPAVFARITRKLDLGEGSRIFIVDENNQIIHDSNGMESVGGHFDQLFSNRKDYYTFSSHLEQNGWSFIDIVPVRVVMSSVRKLTLWMITSLGVCLIFGWVLVSGAASRITRPIRQLRGLMLEMEKGNFNARFHGFQIDEIGDLGRGFNKTSRRIKELIEDVYQAEISSKESQIAALKSEINPHFLFNVLESIRMRAEIGDNLSIRQMILSLGKLMRVSLGDHRPLISLKEEMERVEDYLIIERFNYQGRLRVVQHIPEEVEHLRVLKFIIQPILENAIKHGVEKQMNVLTVEIRAELQDDTLRITLENDGPSIPPDRLARLQYALAEGSNYWSGGIGMMNVQERIRLFYGKEYGITIQERKPQGVLVTIVFPLEDKIS